MLTLSFHIPLHIFPPLKGHSHWGGATIFMPLLYYLHIPHHFLHFLCYFHSTTPLFSHPFSLYSPYPSTLKVRHFYFCLVSLLKGVCWS